MLSINLSELVFEEVYLLAPSLPLFGGGSLQRESAKSRDVNEYL